MTAALSSLCALLALPWHAPARDLGHPRFARRQAASAALARGLPLTAPALCRALASTDPEVRRRARDALAPCTDTLATWRVRAQAAYLLCAPTPGGGLTPAQRGRLSSWPPDALETAARWGREAGGLQFGPAWLAPQGPLDEVEDARRALQAARQAEIHAWLCAYTEAHGRPPTYREVARHFGINSPNGVMCHMRALAKRGLLEPLDRYTRQRLLPRVPPGAPRVEAGALPGGGVRLRLVGRAAVDLDEDEARVLMEELRLAVWGQEGGAD